MRTWRSWTASTQYQRKRDICLCATNAAGDDATGFDTVCAKTLCAADEYTKSNVCTKCPPGTTNAAGDDSSDLDTSCDATLCAANEYVKSNVCTKCAVGKANPAGDDASGSDTTCAGSSLCALNEHVVAGKCVTCDKVSLNAVITTTSNAAGDDYLSAYTMCDITTTGTVPGAAPGAPGGPGGPPADPPAGVSGASPLEVKLTGMISFLVIGFLALAM